ncbi:hypothetical protein HNV12_24850 [Methanococcoides sp. SA1]|nr:hypothetical protein [Methanococcoides sp. SA1]
MICIKNVFKIVAIITLLAVLSNVSAAATDVILQPSSQILEPGDAFTVSPGETFTIDVFVSPDVDIAGMQFDLLFDSSKFQVEGVNEGTLFRQSGMGTFFVGAPVSSGLLDNTYGCILGAADVSTPGTFASITVTVREQASGSSAFLLKDIMISDPTGNAVDLGIVNTEVVILALDI